MTKSEFVKKVLKSKSNTVFVNAEQVMNAMKVFEKFKYYTKTEDMRISHSSESIEVYGRDVFEDKYDK